MTTLEKMKFSSFQILSIPSCEATVTLFYIKYVQESGERGGSTFLEIEMSIPNSKIQIANSPSNFRLMLVRSHMYIYLSVWGEMGHSIYLRHWCTTSPPMVHFEKKYKILSQDIRISFKKLQS